MHINKKTTFDRRRKILSSLSQDSGDEMEGILESDETFFEESEKGNRQLKRKGRKRGSFSLFQKKTKDISSNKYAVTVTAYRNGIMNLRVAPMGRIGKEDIMRSIEKPLSYQSGLCTDEHLSYKGFAIDNRLEHITLRADFNQHVKQGVYHIQNFNYTHNRLKKWWFRHLGECPQSTCKIILGGSYGMRS